MTPQILIIEDDNDIVDILKLTFENEDFEVIGYNRAPDVLDILALSPAIILLDIRIFGSNKTGATMCREIKSEISTSHIPVILLSAEHRLAQIAEECGADGYIVKPFDIDVLKSTVNRYLLRDSPRVDIPFISSTGSVQQAATE